MIPTRDRLKALVHFDQTTGAFTWKISTSNRAKAGTSAGTPNRSGYIVIGIDGKLHYAHRLAWLYVHGHMPKVIDHINGCCSDNRIVNLRDVSQLENAKNSRKSARNSSGIKGISYDKTRKKWRAYLWENGKTRLSKRFDTLEEAIAARRTASEKYQGEFARAA